MQEFIQKYLQRRQAVWNYMSPCGRADAVMPVIAYYLLGLSLPALGVALVVSFSPVGLIFPARLELVFPAAFFVVASPPPLEPALVPVDPDVALLPERDLLDMDLLPDEPLVIGFFVALVVSFSPVGLIWPARLASVLPLALVVLASAAPLLLEVWACTEAVPKVIKNAAIQRGRNRCRMLCLLKRLKQLPIELNGCAWHPCKFCACIFQG